ncbi:MAG: family 78 glycoside hydrolase catalytic domain, partial [Prevotellaceae bacterium]|nr:family 78 glycoside hydrolase catalytic domain [Prevotellaceae bacterium]
MKKFCLTIILLSIIAISGKTQNSMTVLDLQCEYLTNPLGIDIQRPRLSWELASEAKDKKQKAYQILVSTDSLALTLDKADAWDSKKKLGNQTNQVVYQGKPLRSYTIYYWKVRVWDENEKQSEWSSVAHFLVGPFSQKDWSAQWIGDTETPVAPENIYYNHTGYQSEIGAQPDAKKWIVIDLEKEQSFDGIKLYPLQGKENLFPLRFSIETASNSNFSKSKVLADETGNDITVSETAPYEKKFSATATGRYIRINVSKLALIKDEQYSCGLAEIEVLANGKNIALNKKAQASDYLISSGNWEANLLTDGYRKPAGNHNYFANIPPSPLLRKEISINKKIKRAFYYASALGIYEAYINGKKVGKQVFAPEFTDYDKHLQYQTYEVTDLLQTGANALGATLADGWYAGARWSHPWRGGYGFFRKFLGQLMIYYEDGTSETVVTDNSWKYLAQGPITEASYFKGEVYDAKNEQKGWNKSGFDDSKWSKAAAYPDEKTNLCAQLNEPIAIIKEIEPLSLRKIGDDKYIFDMGQNMVGWCNLSLPYNPNKPIVFRYSEMLNDDGSLYMANMRGAIPTDVYNPDKEQIINYEPRFTYHGFRYVEISGLTQSPQLINLKGKVVASSSPETGIFATSNKDINKLWENIRWTQWGNLISIPTDCPQRDEREGWMADAQVFSQTAAFNLDMAGFYTKWARDIRDSQLDDGRFPDFAPHDDKWRQFFNAPGWADAGVVIPWRVYQNYNDTEILAAQYEAMKKFVDFNHKHNPDLIWKNIRANNYGDWLNG